MSKTSTFGYTNVTRSSHTVTPFLPGVTTNYAVTKETADHAELSNKTCPIDLEELVSYRSKIVPQVNTNLNIQYPSKVKSGVQYVITEEAVMSTTDSDDATFRVDEPIVAFLTIRHPRSGNVTNSAVGEIVERLISHCKRADGTWRFDDLMRGAERPIAD